MGRLFWKFFFFFWLAQLLTALGVGIAIWAHFPGRSGGHPPPPPPPHEFGMMLGEREFPPPPPTPPPPRSILPPMMPIVAGSLVSLLFAALLAWYFSRPIRSLKQAFAAAAEGHLDTRAGPAMGTRRDELADLGADFDRMAARLQSLIDGQRRLLHDVSHELRSPLARLQAAADLIQQRPERTAELMTRIERDIGRMDTLVGELLTLARLESGTQEGDLMAVDLNELLEAIADDARLEAESRRCVLQLNLAAVATVQGQPELLQRALENVVRNALRHTPDGSCVSLSSTIAAGNCCVEVADQGPGVAADELAAIFEPFRRGANADGFAGHGLGLAITHRVIEHHGGTVIASNRPEGGLSVVCCLPQAKGETRSAYTQ
jgi:two-component system OmpR family sensor kinase